MSLISSSFRWTGRAGRVALSRLSNVIAETPCQPSRSNLIYSRVVTPATHRFMASNPGGDMQQLSDFEKRILVYNGMYPSVDKVPDAVTRNQLVRAKDWFRIRVNLVMIVVTVFACVGLIYSGKKAAKEGQSVTKQNFDFHRQYQEKMAASKKES